MNIYYECFYTHTRTTIDLSKDRWQCAETLAAAYCKNNHKKLTNRLIENFASGSNLYHTVRGLIENIKSSSFQDVLTIFKGLYPLMHPDWQNALICGLAVKATRREGNYNNTPYIYSNDFCAILIQEINGDLNRITPIINDILEDDTIHPAEMPTEINTITHDAELIPY